MIEGMDVETAKASIGDTTSWLRAGEDMTSSKRLFALENGPSTPPSADAPSPWAIWAAWVRRGLPGEDSRPRGPTSRCSTPSRGTPAMCVCGKIALRSPRICAASAEVVGGADPRRVRKGVRYDRDTIELALLALEEGMSLPSSRASTQGAGRLPHARSLTRPPQRAADVRPRCEGEGPRPLMTETCCSGRCWTT